MTKLLFLGTLLFSTVCLNAQDTESYQEVPNPVAVNPVYGLK